MPCCPQDALCSLNNKMHGIGGDGLAFQAAQKWQTLRSTGSCDDKRVSGTGVLAQRAELGCELHPLFAADNKHVQINLYFSPDLGKLLLMTAQRNNPQNRGVRVLTATQICTVFALHSVLLTCTFFLCEIQRAVWQRERRLSENNEASTSHQHSNNYSSISSLSLARRACGGINIITLLCQPVSHLNTT